MAIISGKASPARKAFKAPGHVSALGLLGIICLIAGVILIVMGDIVTGLVSLLQCCVLLIFQAIAEDAAYSRWRVELLAQDLEVVIAEAAAQTNERIIARQKLEIEEANRRRMAREAAEAEEQ